MFKKFIVKRVLKNIISMNCKQFVKRVLKNIISMNCKQFVVRNTT